MNEKRPHGIWYWLVAMNPLNLLFARLFGGDEGSREGDEAVRDAAPFWAIAAAMAVIILVVAVVMLAGVR